MKTIHNTVINADCFKILPLIQPNSIDLILCDLPYGTTQNEYDQPLPLEDYILTQNKKGKNVFIYKNEFLIEQFKKGLAYQTALNLWNEQKRPGLWHYYLKLIKDHGCIALFAQSPFDKKVASSNTKMYRYEWIIEKTKATGHLNSGKMPMKAHENVLIFYKNLPTYNPQFTHGHSPVHSYTKHTSDGSNYGKTKTGISGGGSTQRFPRDVLKFKWDTQLSSLHENQKPVSLCEYFIKTYTNKGDTVLDNCAGSFTTAVACENLKRNWICIEKKNEFCLNGQERINQNRINKNKKKKPHQPCGMVQIN